MLKLVMGNLGWAYVGIAIGWTVLLACGMLFLYTHRTLPCVRIRRLPVLFAGLCSLHVYGILCILAYVIGPVVSCSTEFWVMSIYLPFGIAMFQAANSQFLHVASRQKQYAHLRSLSDQKPLAEEQAERLANSRWRRILRGVERADRIDRMMVFIAVGLGFQLLLTILVYFASKKFHPAYGLWNWTVQGTVAEVRANCSKGWEWWLSIVWQFFWAWIYAPYMLWKSRGVQDVHAWRLQTICCCIAGLPASPLWLTGLYAPQMAPVNAYFVPPSWFSVSIFLMEVITIGFPIAQIVKSYGLRRETLQATASWEKRQHIDKSCDSVIAESEFSAKSGSYTSRLLSSREAPQARKTSVDSQKSDMFTMAALENALRKNPVPLLQFAALKDFSGENVSFLTHLADWRNAWVSSTPSFVNRHHSQFVAAVRIYAHFVSLDFSEFPINISSRRAKDLHEMFEQPARLLFRQRSIASSSDSVTPFDKVPADSDSTLELNTRVNLDALGRANLHSASRIAEVGHEEALSSIMIPESFTATVFDSAEREIKYLILTNTWPKFVNAGREVAEQSGSMEEGGMNWLDRAIICSA